jgi:hypothetical protein
LPQSDGIVPLRGGGRPVRQAFIQQTRIFSIVPPADVRISSGSISDIAYDRVPEFFTGFLPIKEVITKEENSFLIICFSFLA